MTTTRTPRLQAKSLAVPLLAAAAMFALAWYLRKFYVEPEAIAFACEPHPWQGWCAARSLLIQTFATHGLGWASLAGAALALVTGAALPAYVALLTGMAGVVLYCYEFAAIGALIGLLVIARRLAPQASDDQGASART